jgi:hypothetical protein
MVGIMSADGEVSGALQQRLASWIDTALREGRRGGLTNKGLARELGLDPTQVTRMRKGERAFRVHEIPVIERYLGQKAPGLGGREQVQRVIQEPSAGLISTEAIIAPGAWREAGVIMLSAKKHPALPYPDLAGMHQYVCSFEQDPRRMVICVPYRDKRVHPQDDDLVHVVRKRGGLEEHTLWLTKLQPDGTYALVPEDGGATSLPFPHNGADGNVEVRGLVEADIVRRTTR